MQRGVAAFLSPLVLAARAIDACQYRGEDRLTRQNVCKRTSERLLGWEQEVAVIHPREDGVLHAAFTTNACFGWPSAPPPRFTQRQPKVMPSSRWRRTFVRLTHNFATSFRSWRLPRRLLRGQKCLGLTVGRIPQGGCCCRAPLTTSRCLAWPGSDPGHDICPSLSPVLLLLPWPVTSPSGRIHWAFA